ncbi:TBC1 domain family member 15-like isoform X1 [Asterias rubens]|uniref:TBC1 domain family member 15-like isoform X1 n=1 Tax=Asterias rubens TaxID=7604 RepID=UPI0014558A15|nr:TBC1 domain family member 15-like isoform X1 [Asterias rubens]
MMASGDVETQVLYEQSGVFIHTTQDEAGDVLFGGKIQVIRKSDGAYIEWNPIREIENHSPEKTETDWTVVNAVSYQRENSKVTENVTVAQPSRRSRYAMSFPLVDTKTIRRSKRGLGWSYLMFVLKDGVSLPPLHFHEGGSTALVKELKKHVIISTNLTDSCQLIVLPHNTDALTQSFTELKIMGETSATKFFKDPYTATMGGFSKVTNFLRDTLTTPTASRPFDEYAELMADLPSILSVNSEAEQSYEMVVPESRLGPRPEVERRDPLTKAEWESHLDKEGRVIEVPELLKKIFQGGMDPSIRRDVWKFILKYYPWNSTRTERIALRKRKEDEYFCMKAQWKTITPEQEKRFSTIRERKNIIGMSIKDKDVIRTDRTHAYYEGEHNPHLEILNDVLMTYCQYNFDLGYVQGMSDLLSPILMIMEKEVDAFWCFAGFLDELGLVMNFDMEQEGMRNQLMQLNSMMQIVDPKLYSYLQSKECSNLYFCFRWLLIWFKREFTMDNICRVWEVMWTGLPCKNFHFLMCLAILDGERDLLERENYDFNDILKHVNELSFHIDIEVILRRAEGIYLQLLEYPDLPQALRDVIGLTLEENGTAEDGSHASESSIEVLADPSE